MDRLASDDRVAFVRWDQFVEGVSLAVATIGGVGIHQVLELVASVEPDTLGGQLFLGECFDDPLDVIEIDVGHDHDVELGRLIG